MADSVKVLLMLGMKEVLKTVTGVRDVRWNPTKPADKDASRYISIHIFDEEERVVNRNRIAVGEFPVQLDIYFASSGEEAQRQDGENIRAEVEKILLVGMRELVMKIIPDPSASVNKYIFDEFKGALALRYLVTYSYKWGDPFTSTKTAY